MLQKNKKAKFLIILIKKKKLIIKNKDLEKLIILRNLLWLRKLLQPNGLSRNYKMWLRALNNKMILSIIKLLILLTKYLYWIKDLRKEVQ